MQFQGSDGPISVDSYHALEENLTKVSKQRKWKLLIIKSFFSFFVEKNGVKK